MQPKIYITTAIAYANAAPHMGHALEFIYTDALIRGHRLLGFDVHSLTGTDEHGIKNYQTAQAQNLTPQELVDLNAAKFKALGEQLNLSFSDFIRTSDKTRHYTAAQKIWQQLDTAGYLQKQSYTGLYCLGCERFIPEKDLVDGRCPDHDRTPDEISEENYFFQLSHFSDQIKSLLTDRSVQILPAFRAKELLNVIDEGLKDISFSRPHTTLPWGIPVPNDPDQTMYVWCDALTNYISALGYGSTDDSLFQKYWQPTGEIVHVIGKDILRFHAAIWPGMLLAADLPLPHKILVHGFITSEGKKMSKSLGNVVDPVTLAAEFGADPLRWYLLSEIPHGQDGDFSHTRFREKYQAELANNIGNLVSRIGNLAVNKLAAKLEGEIHPEITAAAETLQNQAKKHLRNFDTHAYCLSVLEYFSFLNAKTERLAPWSILKTGGTETDLSNALTSLAQGIYWGTTYLLPLLPTTAQQIFSQFELEPPTTFTEAHTTHIATMHKGEILFPRLA